MTAASETMKVNITLISMPGLANQFPEQLTRSGLPVWCFAWLVVQ
jgi:hypothetical protein